MKQKDIALIVIVAIVSAAVALALSNVLFGASRSQQKAEVIDPITASFPAPDQRYFNANSVDPTQTITIGNQSNQTPFNTPSQ